MRSIVIIGNGVAGITTARHIRKRTNDRIIVISSESEHFFSRTALMYIFMGHMRFEDTKPYEDYFWEKNKIELIQDRVVKLDPETNSIELLESAPLKYDELVIATGSKPRKLPQLDTHLAGIQSLYHLNDLESLEENCKNAKKAVILGGGLIGIELAEMLVSRNIEVHMLIRESHFWGSNLSEAESELLEQHMTEDHGIHLYPEAELERVTEGDNGRIGSCILKDGREIHCDLLGLTIGVEPNIGFLRNSDLEIDKGILVNSRLQTKYKNIWAAGDCAQLKHPRLGRRAIEPIWYSAKMMGETLAQNICGDHLEYNPGFWFNSAKFFDIEYQTYGSVPAKLEEGQEDWIWTDPQGKRMLRFVYKENDHLLLGISAFGIRLRHLVIDKWLRNGVQLQFSIKHLRDLIFDGEFSKDYAPLILESVNQSLDQNWRLKRFRWSRIQSAKKHWR